VETVKMEITSAVNEALRSRAEEALRKGFAVEIVSVITGLPIEDVQKIADSLTQ